MNHSLGKHLSFWIASTPDTVFPSLEEDLNVDVAVVGAGITGITAGVLLKRAGKKVAIIDAHKVTSGVTGHTTAKITSSHGQLYAQLLQRFGEEGARIYASSNQAAIDQIARLVEEHQIDCDFSRQPNYLYSVSPSELSSLESETRAARTLGLPASFVKEVPLPFTVAGAVRFDDQAQFHPRKYLLHLVNTIPGDESYVLENTRALDVDHGRPCRIKTDRGVITAQDVIIATGMPFLDQGLHFAKAHPYRSYVVCSSISRSQTPPGMFVSTESPTHTVRAAPFQDDSLLIVAGEGHKVGQQQHMIEPYDKLSAWLQSNFDVDSIEYHWSTQDYYSVDHIPYIGKLRAGLDHIYVATGYNAWGLTTGTVAASIIADSILGVPNAWAGLYDATRLNPRVACRKFLEENLNVARHWVGDRVMGAKISSAEELKKGQGATLRVRGKQMAVYRDDQAHIHALSAVCSHLACIVHWNDAEKTWDCPCHGSRFRYDGKILQGPAVKDLTRLDPEGLEHTT
jgi:glycine/D-amino acid oxidase-like deaminating enzyme/nitrite reductase/ring-hydroxylating ferredoxin subunit